MAVASSEWTNYFGNLRCHPVRYERPMTEDAVRESVLRAAEDGLSIRAAGAGHSHSPVVVTDGLVLDVSGLPPRVEAERQGRATIAAGMRLSEIFEPLWDAGKALKNLGDFDGATLAGGISTGVHGTGLGLQCVSASVRGLRIVTAAGVVLEVSAATPELLRAAQISLGMLGVITEIDLEVLPAYDLHETAFYLTFDEALERWDELLASHRHYSFFYFANAAVAGFFQDQFPGLEIPGDGEVCFGMVRDAVDPGEPPPDLGVGERLDRMNRILVYDYDSDYMEAEFCIPLDRAKDVFAEVCQRVRDRYPDCAYPINVRFVAQDDALLSPFSTGPQAVISVIESPAGDWEPFLEDFEAIFVAAGGLPHWGKLHSEKPRFEELLPGLEEFRSIRRSLDPNGVFLNDHLRELFK